MSVDAPPHPTAIDAALETELKALIIDALLLEDVTADAIDSEAPLFGDGEGGLVGAVPMRKLYVTQLGKAWAGVSLDDDALMALTRRFAESTRWRGPFELEFIKSEEDERYHLLEINPRFPAWVYLAVACGQNQPEALVRLAFGEDVPPLPPPAVGRIFIRYSQDLIVDMSDYERIALTGER